MLKIFPSILELSRSCQERFLERRNSATSLHLIGQWGTTQMVSPPVSQIRSSQVLTCSADVDAAYAKIGYTTEYAQVICVEPDEAPDDEILKMHREATQKAADQQDRQEISSALAIIGKHRKNAMMVRFGESGQSLMTVDEAYAALSAPKDSIDDGLIM